MKPAQTIAIAALALFGAKSMASAADSMTFHMVRAELDYGHSEAGERFSWDGQAWVGGDQNKLWLRAEGETIDGNTDQNEVWALYSRAISPFFNLQSGVRYDSEPRGLSHFAIGVEGLAPYMFETEAFGFVSENGDVSARVEQSVDLLVTQRLIAKPHVKIDAFAQDVPKLDIGAGLSKLELGLQIRYEVTRKFAPYIDLDWERKLGETALISRHLGENPSNLALIGGLKVWF